MASSTPTNPVPAAIEYFRRKGMISQLAGLFSVLSLKAKDDEQLRNIQAENSAFRRVFADQQGASGSAANAEDDMGTVVVFGDMTLPPPPSPERPQPSGLSTLAKAGIAAALVGSGAGAALAIPAALELLRPAAQTEATEVIRNQLIERDYSIGEIIVE